MTPINEKKKYIKYARQVIDNQIVACKWIKLACKRFIDWFDRDDIYFDYEDVDMKINFVANMKHFVDEFAGQPFILSDWQQWIFAGIFGFKYVETNYRVTRNVLLFIARKNGKSSLSAALAIACLIADNQKGAQIACVANTTKQASELYDKVDKYVESIDPQQLLFRRYRHSMKVPYTNSTILVHSSEPKGLDGFNASAFILDEYHAATDSKIYDLMKHSQGMRKQPLAIVITTAGYNYGDEFPLYNMWTMCCGILEGDFNDDSQFSAIYMLDEGDDWKDKSVWTKCSPGYPSIVDPQNMDEELNRAQNNPSLEVEFKIKLMNVWTTTSETWIPRDDLVKHMQPIDLKVVGRSNDEDEEYGCYVGIDLSSVDDLTAISYAVVRDEKIYIKTFCYLPRGALNKSKNRELYKKWIKDGYLRVSNTERISYKQIFEDMMEEDKKVPILEIYYDSHNAEQFLDMCENEGLVSYPVSQTLGTFNSITKAFEVMLYNGDIILDDNPVVRWCFANVKLKRDNINDNVKPIKGSGYANKIDAVISILQSLIGARNNNVNNAEIFSI